jgi:hypothetical protein
MNVHLMARTVPTNHMQFYLRYPEILRMINEQKEIISDSVLSVSIGRESLQHIYIFDMWTLIVVT